MSVLGLVAHADLNTLIQQQLSDLAGQAEDEWALLRGHPAGGFLPTNTRDGHGLHVTRERRLGQLFGFLRKVQAKVGNVCI